MVQSTDGFAERDEKIVLAPTLITSGDSDD